jgi:predicted nucleic acid-binding Zn ribbon protein
LRASVLDARPVTRSMIPVTDLRNCEQCGTPFVPRRQHARFCSARCRASWNREHKKSDPAIDASALAWSMTAMRDATQRLPRVRAGDPARAFAAIAEAVWWVTIVDATLVRHHLEAYDRVLASQPTAERRQIEGMLAGLRFVRNGMGLGFDHADFIHPAPRRPGSDRITAWTWKPVLESALASLPPRGRAWEITRYRAYQAQLAGRVIADTFERASEFLSLAAASADLKHEHQRAAAR